METEIVDNITGFLKHVTTLSTAAIVAIATFIEGELEPANCVVVALVGFSCSIVAAISAEFLFVYEGDPRLPRFGNIAKQLIYLMLLSFIVGVFGLMAFAITRVR